jgi:hypothetical protein
MTQRIIFTERVVATRLGEDPVRKRRWVEPARWVIRGSRLLNN